MKTVILSIFITVTLITGAGFLLNQNEDETQSAVENVSIQGDRQIIEIQAKGGYNPIVTTAKADIPSILRVKTRGTFDCSAALVIPALDYQSILKPTGEEEVEIPPQKSGSVLRGLCGMGMYHFEVRFL